MRTLVVVNPTSGNGRGQELLEATLKGQAARVLIGRWGLGDPTAWSVIYTTADGSWKSELQAALGTDGTRSVVAIGGDGTLMTVARVLHGSAAGTGTCLIAVPGGRGNDFVRGLIGYSASTGDFWEWAAARQWRPAPLDLGSCNGQVFINMASVGYGGRVVEKVHTRNALWSRSAAVYQVEGTLALFEGSECQCRIFLDGALYYSGAFFGAFVGNGKGNASGLYWTPDADLSDGKLDALVFSRPGLLAALKTVVAIKRLGGEPAFPHRRCKGAEIRFEFDGPVQLDLDGEYAGAAPSHGFKCLPQVLNTWVLKV